MRDEDIRQDILLLLLKVYNESNKECMVMFLRTGTHSSIVLSF